MLRPPFPTERSVGEFVEEIVRCVAFDSRAAKSNRKRTGESLDARLKRLQEEAKNLKHAGICAQLFRPRLFLFFQGDTMMEQSIEDNSLEDLKTGIECHLVTKHCRRQPNIA